MVNHLAPYLMSIANRYTHQTEDAKDILQESLITIFKNIQQFRSEETAFRSWCARITINTALARFRKIQFQREEYSLSKQPQPLINPTALDHLMEADILKLLNTLPPLPKKVFNLHCIDGFKHHEIAKMLNIEISHSRTILSRARKQLQMMISRPIKIKSNGH